MSPVAATTQSQQQPSPPAESVGDGGVLSLRQVMDLVGDLLPRSPAIYWTDMLLSAGAAWTLTAIFMMVPIWSVAGIASLLGAGILFFRVGTFIHEIIHFQRREMPWFRRTWNLLVGVPLLMPWIFYRNHIEHHSARTFGTPDDGEYLPLASAPLRETIKYLLQAPLLPLFVVVRFGILTPISYLHRGLREWVLTAASAAVSNPYYRRRFPEQEEGTLKIAEALCFSYLVGLGVLVWAGVVTGTHLFKAYLLLSLALTLNWVRNLAAHRYGNRGETMSHVDQFSDSINITGQTWLTILMFPVGLRYHALHHLIPAMPYHNLGKAHARLSRALPPNSPYHATGRRSFFGVVADLWRAARNTPPRDSAVRLWREQNSAS